MNDSPHLKQWHSTDSLMENGENIFIKHYKPHSFEIQNEASWLISNILQKRSHFQVPTIQEVSIQKGYIKMLGVPIVNNGDTEGTLDYLVDCAVELHGLITSDEPHLRTKIGKGEYIDYLKNYTKERIDITQSEFELSDEIVDWIKQGVENFEYGKFSIVHRDLRHRHLLFSENNKPTLIDWEFSNISEPAQDLAKLIFDGVVNHGQDFEIFFNRVVDHYSYERKIPYDLLRSRVLVFLPIIPLEHTASFILRKPDGYMNEVEKDLSFITQVYEQEK